MRDPIEEDPVIEILLALAFAGAVSIVFGLLWAMHAIVVAISGAV